VAALNIVSWLIACGTIATVSPGAATKLGHWQQMEALYHAALESSGEERAALLAQSDPEIRRAVEALLEHGSSGEGLLDRPAWEQAVSLLDPPSRQLTPKTQIESGEQLGPYRVQAKIGAGGMGEVYRANDSRLNRSVAIKVSNAQFSERFEREAKAIAALNHPNICQIYDIGPNYLVMEYVDGSPVVSPAQQPMPPGEVLKLATQIADAIVAAHAKGIVHRDLKPENILVTASGQVKLLDFGLAKQSVALPEHETLTVRATQPGTIMGTPAYMSPEQAEGKSADARSDIFSFGAVLYEMLAGRRAFPGTSAASVLGAILHKQPQALNAPPALHAIVFKCLEKSPADRFQTATALKTALENASTNPGSGMVQRIQRHRPALLVTAALIAILAVALGSYYKWRSAGPIDSIAVLPLEIQSSDPEADYISDGITESINNTLARLPDLRVIPHSVARHYKGKAMDFQKAGEALGVQTVLTGRVVQHGDELIIGMEMDDVRNGKQLWGQQYTRKAADLLMVQNDIAREVSQRLRSQLSAADRQKLTSGSTANPEAYRLYLQGVHYTDKFTKDGFDKGIDYLNQAIALDPNYSLAYSALAYNYINQDDWFLVPREAGPKARDAAKRALALDETNSEAHVVLAIESQWYEWDWATAEREFKRALELEPDDSEARGYYSWFLPSMGRNDEAVAQARRALEPDPISTALNGNLGSVLVFTRQWDKAIEQLRYSIDLDSGYWFDYNFLGRAYEQKGRMAEAIETFQRGLAMDGNTELWAGLGHAYAVSGKKAEAQKVLAHLQEMSAHSYVAPYNVAVVYAGLGDNDAAFEWLNRAYNDRSYILALYLTTDARLDRLHVDPRFDQLRRRIGLPKLN
jgi:serine/threonine protein kinase/Tfp pilus assembly protein PilF